MRKTIEISRELAERIAQWGSVSWLDKEELHAILAEPTAKHHEPYGFASALIDTFKSAIENGKQPIFSKEDLNYFIECLSKCQLVIPAVERQEPVTCDAINEENAPTFMGEPNPQHSINWYRGGISKHWKTICRQHIDIEAITKALRFYADKDHYSTDDALNWDSVSGEPMNILWHEEQPWFIEDGSVARTCLDNLYTLPGTPVSTWTTTDIATADADGFRNGRASVVMPERRVQPNGFTGKGWAELKGWNACLDKFKELNQ